ncbi:DMT family transporter [Carboxylicivirga caseinilyticus]|uniref:DMT family transporter n=1 Tax=Carboxylicivirga caseinilyticus TaxID=3417572 RepID=UPI003D34C899|nr:DMT family transporter [Marinilabiliaceae bacterium A049]
MHHKNTFKAYAAMLAGLIIIGFSAILIKSAEAPGLITAFYRVFIASLVLIMPFLLKWRKVVAIPTKGIVMAILGGVAFGFDTALWSTAIEISNATIPTLMANLAPLWVGFGAMLFFKEKQKKGFWIGLTITLAGILLMVSHSYISKDGLLVSIVLSLIAGMFYGTYYLITQKGRQLMNTLQYLSITSFSAALILGVIVGFSDYNFTGYSDKTWIIYLVYGIGIHVIGWTLINYAQGYLRATTVSPTLLGQPVLTAFFAWLILGESLSVWQISGGIVVFAGIYVVNYSRLKQR